jgi:uncharacterized membrane protein YphA (DoxX/SURF4 family)
VTTRQPIPDELPGPTIKWIYHLSRIIFGGWWLYSGAMPFINPAWQPLGQQQPAIDFSVAMIDSGLMTWVKVAEIVLGLLILVNRMMPLAAVAIIPINFVIIYWNFVLDEGIVEWTFGGLTILFNAILLWPWRRYYWPLLAWRGRPDFSTDPGIQD